MSRFKEAKTILSAAERWKQQCLLDEGSVFTERALWTRDNFEELREHFVERPDEGPGPFLEKVKDQLGRSSADAKCLWAEMTWVYYLAAHRTSAKPATRRKQIQDIWGWSGRDPASDLPEDHEFLKDRLLGAGIVHVGAAFHRLRWKEYCFFVMAMLSWFRLDKKERASLLEQPWDFASRLDNNEFVENRLFRHILLFLLFPEEFETASSKHKRLIIKHLHEGEDPADGDWVGIDKTIIKIRRRLENTPERVNYYLPPVVEMWQPDAAKKWFGTRFPGAAKVWIMNVRLMLDGYGGVDEGGAVATEERWPTVVDNQFVTVSFEVVLIRWTARGRN